MPLSDDDLARAAAGCRALARINERDAAGQSNPQTRAQFVREARELDALAERFERTRDVRRKAEPSGGER